MLQRALQPPTACLLVALTSAGLLVAALALEHLADLRPCQLCLWQRYPYLALIALGLLGWRRGAVWVLGLAVLVLLGEAGLAFYHVGVEQGWWALPAGCAAGGDAQTVEELRTLLAEAPPACDQVAFTLLGLSLTAWNLIAALAMAAFAGLAAASAGSARRP
jgi:disulfide bond formation protein DsbB